MMRDPLDHPSTAQRVTPLLAGFHAARRWVRRAGIKGQLVSLAVVVALFAIGTGGRYLTWSNIRVILSLGAIPTIIAVGMHQVVVLGGMDLSVEGVVALCVVFVGLLTRNNMNKNDVGLWIVPVTLGIGALAGVVSGTCNAKLRIPSFIVTLGMSWVLWGLAVFVSQGQTLALLDTRFHPVVTGSIAGIPNLAVLAVLLTIVVQVLQDHSQFGRYLYAIGGDEVLAKQAGVPVERVKVIVFTTAGLAYGLSALLLSTRLGGAQAITGNNLLFPAVTAVAVGGVALTGGIGGAKNAALGALIVTALNDGLILMHVNPYAQDAVNGAVLVVAVALTIDRKKLGFIK
ncbi:MAG TPA: ABC transporter permease [Anaeromyxobacter sp.]|nr:ABC transporter permease [Anaeromyxobacter sp.]